MNEENERRVTPSEYVRNGVRYKVVPDRSYDSLRSLARKFHCNIMSESSYNRDIQLRQAVIHQNAGNRVAGSERAAAGANVS